MERLLTIPQTVWMLIFYILYSSYVIQLYIYISLHSALNTEWRLCLVQFPSASSNIPSHSCKFHRHPSIEVNGHQRLKCLWDQALSALLSTEMCTLSVQRNFSSIPSLMSLECSRGAPSSVQGRDAPQYRMKFQSLPNLEFYLLYIGLIYTDLAHL